MKNKVPRWLELQAEIDYWHWILKKMLDDYLKRAPIEKMVDESTGYDKEKVKNAKQIMEKIETLKKEYYSL